MHERTALLQRGEEENDRRKERLDREAQELEAQIQEYKAKVAHLEGLAGVTAEEAREELLRETKSEIVRQGEREGKDIYDSTVANAKLESHKVIASTLDRIAREIISEKSLITIQLPSEDMRGRVIGRDGRNARAFEALTGVDVLLDEIEGEVLLSSHSPERREVAKLAMLKLIEDGRIQPSRIKRFVSEAQEELPQQLLRHAKDAVEKVGMKSPTTAVLEVLGRLYLRTSQSQNVLLHLQESASIAGIMCSEMGLSADERAKAVRAAFLHDIGKGLEEGGLESHDLSGAEFLKAQGESEEVVNAVAAHHGKVEDLSLIAPIVRAADTLSGGRPGARREDHMAYIKRLEKLEEIAGGFEGVSQTYCIQAGRELHVWVESSQVSDAEADALAVRIAKRIELSENVSGRVQVVVIREKRSSATAEGANALNV